MDAFIDPVTRDYVPDTGARTGDLVRDPAAGLANACYLRLMVPLGSWWAAPDVGSRLHELAREKDLPRVGQLARQYVRDALAPLLADGRAKSVDVISQQPRDGRLLLGIEVVDALGNRRLFEVPVKVG